MLDSDTNVLCFAVGGLRSLVFVNMTLGRTSRPASYFDPDHHITIALVFEVVHRSVSDVVSNKWAPLSMNELTRNFVLRR